MVMMLHTVFCAKGYLYDDKFNSLWQNLRGIKAMTHDLETKASIAYKKYRACMFIFYILFGTYPQKCFLDLIPRNQNVYHSIVPFLQLKELFVLIPILSTVSKRRDLMNRVLSCISFFLTEGSFYIAAKWSKGG